MTRLSVCAGDQPSMTVTLTLTNQGGADASFQVTSLPALGQGADMVGTHSRPFHVLGVKM